MIKFFNIRSKEVLEADTEPKIAALWGSSDRGPNANVGQDFGWRLAPAVVVELRQIKGDIDILDRIARRIKKSTEELTEPDLIDYISSKTSPENAPVAFDEDYSDEYNDEIRRLENKAKKVSTTTK